MNLQPGMIFCKNILFRWEGYVGSCVQVKIPSNMNNFQRTERVLVKSWRHLSVSVKRMNELATSIPKFACD